MQSSLSKLLVREHGIILEASEVIVALNRSWADDPVAYEKIILQLLDFFSTYADGYHHRKEEDILFPVISKKNEMAGDAIVRELLDHHDDFRSRLQQIRSALGMRDYATVQAHFFSYINALQDHIAVENDELFPMADTLLSSDELELQFHRCQDLDSELGEERKQHLEMLIEKRKIL
ncbi:MAG: hemerythrin domain-containing protein [Saprospirales bacterium]|nr:hemerythrin domain-containing protein [Saprospirales bacterium]